MAQQRAVNERYEVYNKISRRKDEKNRIAEKQEEIRKRKKLDSSKTDISGTEKSESEFEKKEKEDSKSKEAAGAIPSTSTTPGKIPGYTPGRRNRWDYAPGETETTGRGAGGETPTPGRWVDPTPLRAGETPTPRHMGGRSKWDEQPTGGATPVFSTQRDPNLMTPTPEISGNRLQYLMLEKELNEKNKPISDEELSQLLPSQGYEVRVFLHFIIYL